MAQITGGKETHNIIKHGKIRKRELANEIGEKIK